MGARQRPRLQVVARLAGAVLIVQSFATSVRPLRSHSEYLDFCAFEEAIARCFEHYLAASWENGECWNLAITRLVRAWHRPATNTCKEERLSRANRFDGHLPMDPQEKTASPNGMQPG